MSEKNDQNALWQKQNIHNPIFRIVAILEQPQRVLAGEYLPRSKIRVVAV
jgi:hypothetical protein